MCFHHKLTQTHPKKFTTFTIFEKYNIYTTIKITENKQNNLYFFKNKKITFFNLFADN